MEMKTLSKENVNQLKSRAMEKAYPILCSTGVLVSGLSANVCFADTKSANDIMKGIGEKIYEIFKYIGFVLALWGIGQLILAFKNEDADSKSRAIMCIVSGVILFALKSFADNFISL